MSGILATMANKKTTNIPSMGENVANTLNGGGILMQTAKQQGMRTAAQRGLHNSTLGAEAAQRAMLGVAMPIAQIDTQNQFAADQASLDRSHQSTMQRDQHHFARDLTQLQGDISYNNQSRLNQAQNQFVANQANLDRNHQRGMAQLQGDISYNNQNRLNQTQNQFVASQANLDRSHQLGMQTSQQNFTANQAGLDRSHQIAMQGNQNQFVANQAGLDRTHQTNMARLNSELQHNNAMKELGSQVSANTMGKSIDFAMQIHNNFDAQIAAVQNNNQMTAENKKKAIDQLAESRNVQLKFLQDFMQNIPTKHQRWTTFPSLEYPTFQPLPKILGKG